MRLLRRELGLKQADFAGKIGISRGYISEVESGKKPLSQRIVDAVQLHLGGNPAWLLEGKEPMLLPVTPGAGRGDTLTPVPSDDLVHIPIYPDVELAAGHGALPVSEEVGGMLALSGSWLRNQVFVSPANLAALVVSGDSMTPLLHPGELVVLDLSAANQGQISDGIYAVRLHDSLLVKRLQYLTGGKIILTSENPAYRPLEINLAELGENGLAIIGRVVLAVKRF